MINQSVIDRMNQQLDDLLGPKPSEAEAYDWNVDNHDESSQEWLTQEYE